MKYSAAFFRNAFPEWKKKKDSWLLRHFYRPLSFYGASIAAELGFTSNQISFISLIIAVIASCMFLFKPIAFSVAGCILVVFWMILDCIDGNLARSIKAYPYGEFIDAISSYALIGLLFPCIGVKVYNDGGALFPAGISWMIFLGGLAGLADALARLFYQKYMNNSYEYTKKEDISKKDKGKLAKINDRIGKEIGLNGLLIPFLIVSTFLNCCDLFLCFYFLFYSFRLLLSLVVLIRKTNCLKK